tara:strand:- start:929 stop:1696 length:768 start_codon:yes stop_codon:yes gene_type:complete
MKKLILIALFTILFDVCDAQSFNVEDDRLLGVSTLTIKSFNGCCSKKGFRAKYYFNNKGQAVRSEHFFKRQKRAEYEYKYDSLGNLVYKISIYDSNNKGKLDTINYINYELDSENRIIKKTKWSSPELLWTKEYEDFNEFDQPEKIIHYSSLNPDTITRKINYNQNGQSIRIMTQNEDTLRTNEILDYNEQGDLSYSLLPSFVGKEKEPLAIWVGGRRYAPEEKYKYTYDTKNRWTRKYRIVEDDKVLFEKRTYK